MENETIQKDPAAPLCSVCIANYNGEKYLSACLDSVLAQGFAYPVEIIVHDDASSDDSVALIQATYPQAILIKSDTNVGFCVSNNRMAAAAKGNFILLLNNDAFLRKDALKTLYAASQVYGDGIYGLPQYNAATSELIDIGSIFDPFLNPVPNTNKKRQDVGMIIGACLWLPKNLWEKLGGFPAWFESLAEDMYICCLARLWGYPVKALPESGFNHRVGKSFGGGKVLQNGGLATTVKRRALSDRNKTFVMIITCPPPMAYLLIPPHLFLLMLEGLLLTLCKRNTSLFFQIYWSCLTQVWRSRRMLLEKRKSVQTRRQCSTAEFFKSYTFIPHKLRMLFKHGMPDISG
jgi:GT2 family glycosyltransferase